MVCVSDADETQLVDAHRPRRQRHRPAFAGHVIGAPAVDLDRRKCRRRLHHLAGERRKRGLDRRGVGSDAAGLHHLAVGVVGAPPLAPAHRERIGLGPRHHMGDGLGRLAQGHGQHAAGQWVQGAGVPGLRRLKQAARPRHRTGRGRARRLVHDQPTVHRPAAAPPPRHRRLSLRPAPAAAARRPAPHGRRMYRRRSSTAANGAGEGRRRRAY